MAPRVDAGTNSIVYGLAVAIGRPDRGNNQQRSFGGDGFDFTADDVLAALRAALIGRGQTPQAIDVTVAGLTTKASERIVAGIL